jgi:Na+/H+-dicarboxylate symporter
MPVISMLGAFMDPPATMVNASGDTVAAMLVDRLSGPHKPVTASSGIVRVF